MLRRRFFAPAVRALQLGADTLFGQVLRGAGVALLIKVVGLGLAFGSQIVLARWLGAAQLGIYAFAITLAMLLALVAGLGFGRVTARYLPQYAERGDWSRSAGLIRRARTIAALWGCCVGGIGAIVIASGLIVPADAYRAALYAAFILVPLIAQMNLQMEVARAYAWMALAYAPTQMLRQPLMIAGVGILALAGATALPWHALGAMIASVCILMVFQGVLLRRRMAPELRRAAPAYATREWVRVGVPLLLTAGFYYLLTHTDVLMLGIMAGSDKVGIYSVSSNVAGLIALAFIAMTARSSPTIARLVERGDRAALQVFLRQLAVWTMGPTLLAAVLLLLLSDLILGLFGNEFVAGRLVLSILVLSQLINVTAGPVGILLSMTGNHDVNALIAGSCVAVNVLLNAALIPTFGSLGAAAATAATMALWNGALLIVVHHRLGLDPTIRSALRARPGVER